MLGNEWSFICCFFVNHTDIDWCVRIVQKGQNMSNELVFSAIALIAIAIFVPLLMVVTGVLGPRDGGKAKNEAYESGIKNVIGPADQKFSVKF